MGDTLKAEVSCDKCALFFQPIWSWNQQRMRKKLTCRSSWEDDGVYIYPIHEFTRAIGGKRESYQVSTSRLAGNRSIEADVVRYVDTLR